MMPWAPASQAFRGAHLSCGTRKTEAEPRGYSDHPGVPRLQELGGRRTYSKAESRHRGFKPYLPHSCIFPAALRGKPGREARFKSVHAT